MKKVLLTSIFLFISIISFADSNSGGNIELNSLFIESCKFASINDAVKYYELGADINSVDNFGWSSLMWASQDGYTDIIDFLIVNNANINYQEQNNGWTALIAACFKGQTDTVKILIKAGADINPDLSQFRNTSSPLQYSKRFGYTEITDILIQAGAE